MINYYSDGIERKLMDSITSFQQYQKDYSNLKEVLHQLVTEIAPFEPSLSNESCKATLSTLTHHLHRFLKRTFEREDELSGLSPSMNEFSCQCCQEMLYHPITLSCGHSFCYDCMHEKPMQRCFVCGEKISQDKRHIYRTNVTLTKILKMWHSAEISGRSLVTDGLRLFSKCQYKEAIEVFSRALHNVPNSHIAIIHRAEARLLLGNLDEALKDACLAVTLAHKWAKPHHLKGEILYKQQRDEEALFSFLMCLVLDPADVSAEERAKNIIIKLLTSTSEKVNPDEQETKNGSPAHQDVSLTVPPKHSFSGTWESSSTTEDITNRIGFSYGVVETHASSCTNVFNKETDSWGSFRQPPGESHSVITTETERALDRIIIAHYTFNGCLSLSNKSGDLPAKYVSPALIDPSEFECSLCMRLFYNPVCTPCGHTFCQMCIERCLDHSTLCPLCKESIKDNLSDLLQKMHTNCDHVLNSIMKLYLPALYKERVKQHEEEIADINESQPVFVCTIAFPSVPCPLHIFEPRYRLMLRRCLQFCRSEFGMCMPEGFRHSEIGTLLKVQDVSYFPDGRSLVRTVGIRRFKTTNSHIKDGYTVAKFNYIVDDRIRDPQATSDLCTKVYCEAQAWFETLPQAVKDRIINHFDIFPQMDTNITGENGPDWHWWVLAVLPVEDRIKITVLEKNLLHERMLIIHRIFLCLKRRKAR